jgi:hypothetical protein
MITMAEIVAASAAMGDPFSTHHQPIIWVPA